MKDYYLRGQIKKRKYGKNDEESWRICRETEKAIFKARGKDCIGVYIKVAIGVAIVNLIALWFGVMTYTPIGTKPMSLKYKIEEVISHGVLLDFSIRALLLFALFLFIVCLVGFEDLGNAPTISYRGLTKINARCLYLCLKDYSKKLEPTHNIVDLTQFNEKVRMTNVNAIKYLISYQDRIDRMKQNIRYRPNDLPRTELDALFNRTWNTYMEAATDDTMGIAEYLFEPISLAIENSKYVVSKYEQDIQGLQKGLQGEDRISRSLEKYSSEIINLQNVILPTYQNDIKTSELDNLLITPYGLFVLEVKNWGSSSTTIRIEQDGRWLRCKGNHFDVVPNVTEQNIFHCLTLKKNLHNNEMLNSLGLQQEIPIYSLVVIANDEITIENYSSEKVIRTATIYPEIIKYPKILTMKQMLTIKQVVAQKQLPDNQFEQFNYEKLITLVEKDLQFVTSHTELMTQFYKDMRNCRGSEDY